MMSAARTRLLKRFVQLLIAAALVFTFIDGVLLRLTLW